MDQMKILLVGVGGYAVNYIRELRKNGAQNGLKLEGAVDPYARQSSEYQTLIDMNVPLYDTPDAFYAEHDADFAVICTPIPFHAPQAVFCMEHGSHVLCEKPIAGTLVDAERMIEARDRTGKYLGVGFQWCYDSAMLSFRKDVQSGLFGRLISMRSIIIWPRDVAYYQRGGGWAGKKYDKNGNPIFDSVASNATAHYLENMLWVAGKNPTAVEFVTARANPIETFDTIVLKGKLDDADLTYVATHACRAADYQDPYFEYVFEKGEVIFGGRGIATGSGAPLVARMNDGSLKEYGATYPNGIDKLRRMVELIRGETDSLPCTAEDAMLHTRVMDLVNRKEAFVFPKDRVVLSDNMYWTPGLAETLWNCFDERKLPRF